jgi:hypothetical protein
MLPTETDLNTPPLLANFPEKVLPVGAVHSKTTAGGANSSSLYLIMIMMVITVSFFGASCIVNYQI